MPAMDLPGYESESIRRVAQFSGLSVIASPRGVAQSTSTVGAPAAGRNDRASTAEYERGGEG